MQPKEGHKSSTKGKWIVLALFFVVVVLHCDWLSCYSDKTSE